MIAIVCHDAGGAEILSSWLCQNEESYCLVIEGPAIEIFKRKLGAVKVFPLEVAVKLSDWVLCGSSWQSNLEKHAVLLAREINKKVIVFLDHWANYPERFELNGITSLPDEIWIGDEYAQKIASKYFPEVQIRLKDNPYFKDLLSEISNHKKQVENLQKCSILYICEPIREHALRQYGDEFYWGYSEEDALNFFLKNLNVLSCSIGEIVIRKHPSEIRGKYDWAKEINPLVTEKSSTKTLIEQIVKADIIIGCESMAMVVGLMAKKRVISSIPIKGKSCILPYPNIEHLQTLVKEYQRAFSG